MSTIDEFKDFDKTLGSIYEDLFDIGVDLTNVINNIDSYWNGSAAGAATEVLAEINTKINEQINEVTEFGSRMSTSIHVYEDVREEYEKDQISIAADNLFNLENFDETVKDAKDTFDAIVNDIKNSCKDIPSVPEEYYIPYKDKI